MPEFVSIFADGGLAANIGNAPASVPMLATNVCTIYQILSGQAGGMRGQAEALERWLNEQRTGIIAGGLGIFDWAGPGAGTENRSRRVRYNAVENFGFGVARITDPAWLLRGRFIHDLELEFCSVGAPTLTASLAAADAARLPIGYRAGSVDLVLPYGDHGFARVNARPEKALAETIPAGRMNPVPFWRMTTAAAGGSNANGFTPTITTDDRCFAVWLRAGGTDLGSMPNFRGWVAPADGNGFTGGLLTGTNCQARLAFMSAHAAGAVDGTGGVTNATRTYAGAYRGGIIGSMYAYAGQEGSGTSITFPHFLDLPPAAKVIGVTLRNTTTIAVPAGAEIVRENAGASWSSAYWESPQGVRDWEPEPLDQPGIDWLSIAAVMVSS